MISVELIKRRGKCDDICNACSNEVANFRIRYGGADNNRIVISLCRKCGQELIKTLRRADKSEMSNV